MNRKKPNLSAARDGAKKAPPLSSALAKTKMVESEIVSQLERGRFK
jgi:hypothetical protein